MYLYLNIFCVDEQLEILLNSQKNIVSINVDTHQKIELNNNISKLNEYDIRKVISATEIFDNEREGNETYRIYGKIEWMSMLNGLKNNYKNLDDFFNPVITNGKTPKSSFLYYLVKPSVNSTKITSKSNQYIRTFEVIATPNEFDMFPAAFSNNVFGERAYAFIFNSSFDVSNYLDSFGFPLTELYLYAKYVKATNGNNRIESIQYSSWNVTTGAVGKTTLADTTLTIGSMVYGDLITYDKLNFRQSELNQQTYYITTPYSTSSRLIWKYNPYIPLTLRYFSNELYNANIGDTSYEQVTSIPSYATKLDNNGNYIWRTILPQGFIDPLTGIGVDYPFVNEKRYLFSSIIIDIIPDLTDTATKTIFNKIWFSRNSIINDITPIGDLDNIGKPCQ